MSVVKFLLLATCVFAVTSTHSNAQQDLDLEPNDLPIWDALERYRDDPLCLRSIDARELTVLPGISLRTAHRITRIVATRPDFSFENLADSACLSVEQMLVLASCTTLDCSARPFIRSAWTRLRLRDQRTVARADVVSESGRIGGVLDSASASFWLSGTVHNTTLHLGAVRASAGMGLLLGGSGRFGSTISARSSSNSDDPSVRAHTSSYMDGAFYGIAVQHNDSLWNAVAGYSKRDSGRQEEAAYAATQCRIINNVTIGVAALGLRYDKPSVSRAASLVSAASQVNTSLFATYEDESVSATAECVMDDKLASALAFIVRRIAYARQPRWSVGLRHFSAEYRAPYASAISDASAIGNEYGLFVATEMRLDTWTLTSSLDIHGSLAPRFGSPLPTRGFDIQLRAAAPGSKGPMTKCAFDLQTRYECDSEGWRPENESFTRMHTRTRLTLRGEATLAVTDALNLRTRVDARSAVFSSLRASEFGWASFVDVQWQATAWFDLRVRLTLFNAPSIDVAPYFLETDALGAMRTVACSGQGSRTHVAMRFNPFSFLTLSLSAVREERTLAESRPMSGLLQLDVRLPTKP